MAMRLPDAETVIARGGLPAMLCTITLPDGRRLRFADQPITVATRTSEDGPYQYLPLLSGVSDFDEEVDPFGLDASSVLTQARVSIATTDDLAAMQGDWYAVTAATAEVALIWSGQLWHERITILAGARTQSVAFGVVGEVTTFSLEAGPAPTSADVGDDSRDIGADFPAPLLDTALGTMTDLAGSAYPIVIGTPSSVPAFKMGAVAGMNRLILCGHHLPDLSSVTVYVDGVSVGGFTPANATATSGDYAYVSSAVQFTAATGAYTWNAAHGGIAAADDANKPALGADGVLRYLLVASGLTIDWRRMLPTLAFLREWPFGIVADKQASAVSIIRDRLLDVLPLIEINGADGLWFLYAEPHRAPVEAQLFAGVQLVGRVGAMETTDIEQVRNSFSISFDFEAFSGDYLSTVTLDATNSALCYLSKQLYCVSAEDVIETAAFSDATSAMMSLRARASRAALPRRKLVYDLSPDSYWLAAGMVVEITDAAFGIASHRAAITKMSRSGFPFRATFELLDRTPAEP